MENLETPNETMRRELRDAVEAEATERAALEARHGQVWDTEQLKAEFEVKGFCAPFIRARRRSDGKLGLLMFQAHPRYYFLWEPE